MSIELTQEQQRALDQEGLGLQRVVDPRTSAAYVLVPEELYKEMLDLLEDERREQAIHAVALRNAAGRLDEVT